MLRISSVRVWGLVNKQTEKLGERTAKVLTGATPLLWMMMSLR